MTAVQQLIEIIKQKRKESEISNTLLRFVHDEAVKLLETEKEQQDEFAIGFAEWCTETKNKLGYHEYKKEWYVWDLDKWVITKELLKIYKNETKR